MQFGTSEARQGLKGPRERVNPSPIPVLERGRCAFKKNTIVKYYRYRCDRRQQSLKGSIFGCLVVWAACAQGEHLPAAISSSCAARYNPRILTSSYPQLKMQRNLTAVSSHLPNDPGAHLSVVETSRVDFHEYFTRFKRGDGLFYDTYIILEGLVLLLARVL